MNSLTFLHKEYCHVQLCMPNTRSHRSLNSKRIRPPPHIHSSIPEDSSDLPGRNDGFTFDGIDRLSVVLIHASSNYGNATIAKVVHSILYRLNGKEGRDAIIPTGCQTWVICFGMETHLMLAESSTFLFSLVQWEPWASKINKPDCSGHWFSLR